MTVEAWERRAEVPLLLLAVAFLVAYAWPVLDPRLEPSLLLWLEVVSWAVWTAFVVDFVVRVVLTTNRSRYVVSHWYDVALIALPMLRPLRLLRLLAFARLLNRTAVGGLAGRVTTYMIGTAVMAIGLGSVAILDAERGATGGTIETFDDALWWATTTVTTVGYGDLYPVTGLGRLIAVTLMIVGIAVAGSVTAAIATWFVKAVEADGVARS